MEDSLLTGIIFPMYYLRWRKKKSNLQNEKAMMIMDAENKIFEHYNVILKIVQIKAAQYNLDYDDCLNFVLYEIRKSDHKKTDQGGDPRRWWLRRR